MDELLSDLAHSIEASLAIDAALADRTIAQLHRSTGAPQLERSHLESSERLLALIYELRPGWTVSVKGVARFPNGHWRCTLRQSELRDNDEFVGVGSGPTMAHAMLVAMLKVLALAP
ncbi:hypothetical protein OEW28_14720 [Defluviimonas sp. WL0002]|uniref:Uncharacterized protein n=1 Tax=Albidovulum marisflavi TaxID=2984159 RepID=A0ABT2ZFL9_9RHOB|nr:hypothetical protein [Defluviimonas sp. WL0002]MCV2869884.1 hypothetical protein [Defluviimonas sp. WL0002]